MTSSKTELKRELQQMDPYEFEKLVADIWELEGYETEVRKGSRDKGIDIVATRDSPVPEKILIQAKRYSTDNKLGSQEIRKYRTLYQQVDNVDSVVIVTTGEATSEAKGLAAELDVKVLEGNALSKILHENAGEKLLQEYNLLTKDSANSEHQRKHPSTAKKEQATNQKFDACVICDDHNFTIRQGTCLSCGSEWIGKKSKPDDIWKVKGGPRDGERRSIPGWRNELSQIKQVSGSSPPSERKRSQESRRSGTQDSDQNPTMSRAVGNLFKFLRKEWELTDRPWLAFIVVGIPTIVAILFMVVFLITLLASLFV